MKLEIVMMGKIHDKPYKTMIDEYIQRCSGRLSIELIHCRNEAEMEKRLAGKELVVALDERGGNFDSAEFSRWLSGKIQSGSNRVTFVLGAAAGLSKKIRETAREFMSMSRFTLNHQLALLVLTEQIYRALSILFGEPYHKA